MVRGDGSGWVGVGVVWEWGSDWGGWRGGSD